MLPSVSTLIADIPPSTQITSIKPATYMVSEDSSSKFDMNVTAKDVYDRYDEMELVLEKPLVRDSSTTLLASIQPGLELKSIQPTQRITTTNTQESTSTFTMERDRWQEDSSSVVLANVQPNLGVHGHLKPSPYVPQPMEESSSTLLMDMSTTQQTAPVELIIPRFDVESSTSTVLAQVAPALAGSRTKVDVTHLEKSTSTVLFEQTNHSDREVEMIMPKPKYVDSSTSRMLADVQGKLETRNVHPSEFQPETATSTVLFDRTTHTALPQPVELRMRQPTLADSSTTLLANVKATLDTHQVQILGRADRLLERSSSEILFDTTIEQMEQPEVELILPRPLIQESTSVMLANVRQTLDTSQTHVVVPPPPRPLMQSSSQTIIDRDYFEQTAGESPLRRQPSSHTVVTESTDTRTEQDDTYVLGASTQQWQTYGSPAIHADLNKPLELVFNVDGGMASSVSQRGHASRILGHSPVRRDNNSSILTGTPFPACDAHSRACF